MVAGGYSNVVAIDKIYAVYGNKEVSAILRGMSKDRRNGWPDELTIN